ncbi:MAG: DNA phosphorothioation-associated putative methyltransferase [Terriglobales bacterium]
MMSVGQLQQPEVKREKTAIVRFRHSKPVLLALSHSVIEPSTSVFDYGCGRGEDVNYLRSQGIQASGWDPHYQPDTTPAAADVVNLGYVLNVIEDPVERQVTLLKAYELAQRALVVAVRVDHALLETGIEFSDGLLTSRGSFQKLYKQSEFKEYLEKSLGRRPHMVALGIAYIFKDENLESSYLVSLSHKRVEASSRYALEQFSRDPTAQKYVQVAERLGRPPVSGEFEDYTRLLERFGSPARVERLASQLLSPNGINEVQLKRREDILTYAAMMRLQGVKPVRFRLLPSELQADIKMLWQSYSAALREGESFLFQIGNPETVRSCCQCSVVGKKLPDALYLHRSAEDQIGALLRLLVFAARQIVGEVDYNVLKISMDGRSISFLRYDDFDHDAHPALRYSVRIYLPRAEYSIRDYSHSLNPPVLHRKEMLVDPLHESYKAFCELSTKEEQLGLLSRADIGRRQEWLAVLAEKGVTIEGHEIVPAISSAKDLLSGAGHNVAEE